MNGTYPALAFDGVHVYGAFSVPRDGVIDRFALDSSATGTLRLPPGTT